MTKAETVRGLMERDKLLAGMVGDAIEIKADDGETYDEAEAFDYIISLHFDNDDTLPKQMAAMKKALVATGDVVPVDITRIYAAMGGGKRYLFKLGGAHYAWRVGGSGVPDPESAPTTRGITFKKSS